MKAVSILPFLAALFLSLARGAPIDDLASPDQSARDKAAKELRTTFQGTPETKWTPTIEKLNKGQTKNEILEILRPFKVTEEAGKGTGPSYAQSYRLDNEWTLLCWFRIDGDVLFDWKLIPALKHIRVVPGEDFTGVWTVYFVNGHKSHQINYRKGKYFGEFIAYRSDGSKAYVQHYTADGIDGESTGYHPSGDISYRAHYRSGKSVGTWTWYDEAGKVTSTREHSNP